MAESLHLKMRVNGEPFLIKGGFLDRTPRGRMATRNAFAHFGFEPPGGPPGRAGASKRNQGKLF